MASAFTSQDEKRYVPKPCSGFLLRFCSLRHVIASEAMEEILILAKDKEISRWFLEEGM